MHLFSCALWKLKARKKGDMLNSEGIQILKLTEYFKWYVIYPSTYEWTILPARSELSFFFPLHSLQLCETQTHTHINYPRSRNFLSLAQQLRSVINHFIGGTEADFWKKSQTFFKPLGAGPLFLYHSPTAYDRLAH